MPNRILKESICTSDTLDSLTPEEERFFYRLLVQCDDYGRMDARPAILRARCFPLKIETTPESLIIEWLSAFQRVGLMRLYVVNERPFLEMVTWKNHQPIRAQRSKYPSPEEGTYIESASTCKQMHADESTCPRIRIRNRIRESNTSQLETKTNAGSALFGQGDIPWQLASLLREKILLRNGKAKVPLVGSGPFQVWCRHIDLMIRADGRDPPDIHAVIEWAHADNFWHQNILSTRSLREKFDRLYLGYQQSKRGVVVVARNGTKPIVEGPEYETFRADNRKKLTG